MATNKDYGFLEEKKKRYRNHIIVYAITLIPCLAALIGFNLLLLYPAFTLFLALISVGLDGFDLVFFVNGFLIIFDSLIGLFLVNAVRGFITSKRKIVRKPIF